MCSLTLLLFPPESVTAELQLAVGVVVFSMSDRDIQTYIGGRG